MTNERDETEKTEAIPNADNGDPGVPLRGEQSNQDLLTEKLETALREAEGYRDQLLRKAAEFENYKRRMEGEYRMVIENATERLILDLLPVLDDFDRFLRSSKEERVNDALVRGIELIYNKLNKALSLRGLATFESLGKHFDVQYHDALLQIPRDDVPPQTVVEEVNRGYMLNGKVLRHAKVVVSTDPGPPNDSDNTARQTGTEETQA